MVWVLYVSTPSAWACAGIAHEEGVLAESDAAEVLFDPAAGSVAVSYAVRYTGDAPDLGWVVPVPGIPSLVEDGDRASFDVLRGETQPRVEYQYGGDGGAGCLCGGSKGDAGSLGGSRSDDDDVTVLTEGFTGTYDYVVIGASDATDLDAWFSDNGWTGLATEDLDHYVALGSTFVAIRVVPDAVTTGAGTTRELPPVRITYDGDEMRFPAVMALHAAVADQRTTIYVTSDTRAALTDGWSSQDGTTITGVEGDDPDALWDAHVAAIGEGRGYVRTFAGQGDLDVFVTRFDTIAPREVHDADPVFVLETSTSAVTSGVVLEEEDEGTNAGLLLVPLVGLGALRRRVG